MPKKQLFYWKLESLCEANKWVSPIEARRKYNIPDDARLLMTAKEEGEYPLFILESHGVQQTWEILEWSGARWINLNNTHPTCPGLWCNIDDQGAQNALWSAQSDMETIKEGLESLNRNLGISG